MNLNDDRRVASDRAQYLTASELVTRWKNQVSTRTLANWRVLGSGPSFVKIGNRVLYELGSVVEWEQSRFQRTTKRKQ